MTIYFGIESRRCIFYKHPDFNRNGPWMKSEIAKKYKAVGQHWLHLDKQLVDGKLITRSKEEIAALVLQRKVFFTRFTTVR